ncbi:hypothetical protein [Pantoea sp.]|uniref:hypothetical protein n=1 Tax=Pantoea sp. TaxID=69393 RepID=UPI0031E0F62C
MKLTDKQAKNDEIPVFATTAAAAFYKAGDESFIDILFLRSHFVIDDSEPSDIDGTEGLLAQKASMQFAKVAAVSITASQASDLISALQHQLTSNGFVKK